MKHTIYFGNNGAKQATPFRIKVKGYEISIAGDDSCGAFKDFYRTDLIIFNSNDENVKQVLAPTFQDIVDAVKWCEEN